MVLLYDGECGFCRWATVVALRRDQRGVIEPVAIQAQRGQKLLADLAPERRLDSLRVITDANQRLSGGAALCALLEILPGHRLACVASLSPSVTDAAYRFVARHRRTLSRVLGSRTKRRAEETLRSWEPRARL